MKKVYLDKIYQAPSNKPVLIVVDLRVALYLMLQKAQAIKGKADLKLMWQYYLNSIASTISNSLRIKKDVFVCVVDDWRSGTNYNYWREDWLREFHPQGAVYKGNRGTTCDDDRPDAYNEMLQAAHEYCAELNIPIFRQEGFEADDFAGSFYRQANGKWQTILVSIDNDWAQLICNKKDIIQYINGIFKAPISKIRSEYEVYEYYKIREDFIMNNTYEIVDYKSEFGDAGDNIMCGTPREIIDLRNPPMKPEFDYTRIFKYRPNNIQALEALQEISTVTNLLHR